MFAKAGASNIIYNTEKIPPKKEAEAELKVSDHCYDSAVIVRASGKNVIIAPPLIVTTEDVTRILAALDGALGSV